MPNRTLDLEAGQDVILSEAQAEDEPIGVLVAGRLHRAGEGDIDAMVDLGLIHSSGGEAPLDYVAAHMWLNLAAQAGSEEARLLRAELALGMSRAEIAEAQRRARDWIARRLH